MLGLVFFYLFGMRRPKLKLNELFPKKTIKETIKQKEYNICVENKINVISNILRNSGENFSISMLPERKK